MQAQRDFAYEEINVMEPGHEKWKSVYEFDTPVVWLPRPVVSMVPWYDTDFQKLHIDNASAAETTTSAIKLMHRFKEVEVLQKLDEAERL